MKGWNKQWMDNGKNVACQTVAIDEETGWKKQRSTLQVNIDRRTNNETSGIRQ